MMRGLGLNPKPQTPHPKLNSLTIDQVTEEVMNNLSGMSPTVSLAAIKEYGHRISMHGNPSLKPSLKPSLTPSIKPSHKPSLKP